MQIEIEKLKTIVRKLKEQSNYYTIELLEDGLVLECRQKYFSSEIRIVKIISWLEIISVKDINVLINNYTQLIEKDIVTAIEKINAQSL